MDSEMHFCDFRFDDAFPPDMTLAVAWELNIKNQSLHMFDWGYQIRPKTEKYCLVYARNCSPVSTPSHPITCATLVTVFVLSSAISCS